jgi:DNA repair exonuclease SbcCD ATPase subunit
MSKIIVDRVEIKNFLSYGNQWAEFDFQTGINVVLGQNKDKDRSNGAGKTSFLEAIPFALFGKTNKDITLNEMINWKNGKKCEVRLHFQKAGVPYIIHRGIKPGNLTLFRDGTEVPKLSDKRLFQAELENDLIGMDFKAAQAILFQNANNMVSLFNTPKAEKRRFIEKFFNLEIYSKATEVTNKKLRGVEEKLTEIGLDVSYKQRTIDDLSSKISSFVPPEISVYEGNVVVLQAQYSTLLDMNPDIEGKINVIHQEQADLVGRRNETERDLLEEKEKLGDIRLEIRTLSTEASTKRERYDAIGDLSDQREKLVKVRTALEKFENVHTKCEEAKELRESIRDEITENKTKLRESGVYLANYNTEMGQLQWQLENKTEEAECPTCYQEVDHEHIKDHLESQIAGKQRELNLVTAEVANIEGLIEDREQRFTDAAQRVLDYEKQITQKTQLEQALAKLEGVEEKELEQNELEQRITELDTVIIPEYRDKETVQREYIEEIQSQFDSMVQELVDYDEDIEKCREAKRAIEKASTELDAAESILENQREILDRLVGENEANIATKAQLESEIVSTQSEVKKLETMKDYLEHIRFTLKDENVKQYAISNIVPYLQQQTNHYLAETGHDYYIELDSWLDGQIKGYGVGESSFGNMSGGEGKSIDLALKFGMMDVARRQAGSYMDVLVLDELLDSSIDSYGLEKTMDIVRLKQHEDNLKVFIVSHREEVSAFEADRIYQVTKENGLSTIGLVGG